MLLQELYKLIEAQWYNCNAMHTNPYSTILTVYGRGYTYC